MPSIRTRSSSHRGAKRVRCATARPRRRARRDCRGGARTNAARWSRSSTTRPYSCRSGCATTRAGSAPRTSTCSTTTAPTARPTGAASSASRRRATGSTMSGWPRPWRPSSTTCSSRYDVVLVTDVDEILAPLPRVGHARRLHRPARRGVRQPARIRGPAPARSGAAARPLSPGARPARLLVRQRRLRQADAGDGADDLGPGPARQRRRPPQLRSGPAPDSPPSHGPRRSAAPATPSARDAPGTTRDLDRDWASYNRVDEGAEFDRWFLDRLRLRERGDPHRLRADPGFVAGAGVNPLAADRRSCRPAAPTGSRSRRRPGLPSIGSGWS